VTKTPIHQKAILTENGKSTVRIFSPFRDNGSTICGTNFTKNTLDIQEGYTDVTIAEECTVYTSQLRLVSPYPTSDRTEVRVSTLIPNITTILDSLFDDLSTLHGQNITNLLNDYTELTKDINLEQKKLYEIQSTLNTHATLKQLENFTITEIDVNKLHTPREQAKIMAWSVIIIGILLMTFTCYCCCPSGVRDLFKALITVIVTSFSWITQGILAAVRRLPTPMRNRTPPPDYEMGEPSWDEDRPIRNRPLPQPNANDFLGHDLFVQQRSRNNSDQSGARAPVIHQPKPDKAPMMSQTYDVPHRQLYPNTGPPSLNSTPLQEDHGWKIIKLGASRILLKMRQNGTNITYLPELGMSFTDFGVSTNEPLPSEELIQEYVEAFLKLPYTKVSDFQEKNGSNWGHNTYLNSFWTLIDAHRIIHKFGFKIQPTHQPA